MSIVDAWEGAPEPVRVAIGLAWDAYRNGSLPVGAVITDPTDGRVVARGRNRIADLGRDGRGVAGTQVAHAELDALVDLGGHRPGLELISTLEPCLMCAGAILVCQLAHTTYLASDPYAGSSDVGGLAQRVRWRGGGIHAGSDAALSRFASGLVTEYMLRYGRHADALEVWQHEATGYTLGTRLLTRGRLNDLARSDVPVDAAIEVAARISEQSPDSVPPGAI